MIDSENVGSTWIDLLQSDEKIDFYIFVTENAKSLNYSLLKQLTENPRHKINIIECEPGKNSLDFYLSSYVGYLIGKGKHLSYTVVSQDTGYDHVIEYWKREGIDVKRINTKNDGEKKKTRRNQSRPAKTAPAKPAANSETRVIVKKQPEELKKQVQEQKKQSEQVKKQTQEPKKQTEQVKKQSQEPKNQVQEQKKQIEPARKPAEEPKKQSEPVKKQVEETKKQTEQIKQPEELKKQAEEASQPQVETKETPAKPKTRKRKTKTSAKKQDDGARQKLKEVMKDYSEEDQEDVCRYLDKVPAEKRSDKNYIYRGLVRKFKSEKGLAIYTLIKKELDRYYNPATENKQ